MNAGRHNKSSRVFYGWWIVAAGHCIGILHGWFYFYGGGIFVPLLLKHLGSSTAALGGAFGLSRLQGGLLAPLAGWFIDHYGPRRLLFPGLFIMGLGFLALSQITHLWMLYVVLIVLSMGASAGGAQPVTIAVANWFVRKRSRAMGLIFAGFGLGGSLGFILAWMIETVGWQTAAMLAGLAFWCFGFPLAYVIRHRPEQMGLEPDGGPPVIPHDNSGVIGEEEASPTSADVTQHQWSEQELTPRQALRTRAFWMLAIAFGVWAPLNAVANIYQVTYLTQELGASLVIAAWAHSAFALLSTPGRVVFGWMGDRVNTRLLLTIMYGLQVIGLFVLSLIPNIRWAPLYLLLLAPAYGGSVPLRTALVAQFYGRKNFGTITGMLAFVDLPGTFLGPIFVGLAFDTLGSFRLGFQVIAILLIVGTVAVMLAQRPRVPEEGLTA